MCHALRAAILAFVCIPSWLVHGIVGQDKRISTSEAEKLVAAWVKAHRVEPVYWHPHPRLKDITPADVSRVLGGQVFKQMDYTGSTDEVDAYFIKGDVATPMSIGFGGFG